MEFSGSGGMYHFGRLDVNFSTVCVILVIHFVELEICRCWGEIKSVVVASNVVLVYFCLQIQVKSPSFSLAYNHIFI